MPPPSCSFAGQSRFLKKHSGRSIPTPKPCGRISRFAGTDEIREFVRLKLLAILNIFLYHCIEMSAAKQRNFQLTLRAPFPLELLVRTPEKVRERLEMGDGFMREILKIRKDPL